MSPVTPTNSLVGRRLEGSTLGFHTKSMWCSPLLFLVASCWLFWVEAETKGEKQLDDEDSSSHHYLRLGKRAAGTGKEDAAPPNDFDLRAMKRTSDGNPFIFLRKEYRGGLKRNRPQLKKASATIVVMVQDIC